MLLKRNTANSRFLCCFKNISIHPRQERLHDAALTNHRKFSGAQKAKIHLLPLPHARYRLSRELCSMLSSVLKLREVPSLSFVITEGRKPECGKQFFILGPAVTRDILFMLHCQSPSHGHPSIRRPKGKLYYVPRKKNNIRGKKKQ